MANLKIARGERGRQFADAVINQQEVDAAGQPDDTHITNPVLKRLREQARTGVGSEPGQLPAAAFAHLCDRAFGKESEKLAVRGPGKPFEDLTTDQLAERMEKLAAGLRGDK